LLCFGFVYMFRVIVEFGDLNVCAGYQEPWGSR
jgi:hypothetical protein